MDIKPEILTPTKVTAYYLPSEIVGESKLLIKAAGHADGVRNIRIIEVVDPLVPLGRVFEVVGNPFPAPIAFPYAVQNDFPTGPNPSRITIKTTGGAETVPVLPGPPTADDLRTELNPETVKATYTLSPLVDEGTLCIDASGREDGVANIHVEQTGSTTFEVVGDLSPIVGNFPYSIRNCFTCAQDPGTITVGTQTVPVRRIPKTDSASAHPEPGTLGTNTAPGGFPGGPGRKP